MAPTHIRGGEVGGGGGGIAAAAAMATAAARGAGIAKGWLAAWWVSEVGGLCVSGWRSWRVQGLVERNGIEVRDEDSD